MRGILSEMSSLWMAGSSVASPLRGSLHSMRADSVDQQLVLVCSSTGGVACLRVDDPMQAGYAWKFPPILHRGAESSQVPLSGVRASSIQWYPHDTNMFITAAGSSIHLWDTDSQTCFFSLEIPNCGLLQQLHMSPNATAHTLLGIAAEQGKTILCDLRTGHATHMLEGHKGGVKTLAFAPLDTYILATGGQDGCIRLWDIRNSRILHSLDAHNICWDVKEGAMAQETVRHHARAVPSMGTAHAFKEQAHRGSLQQLLFAPSGLYLYSLADDPQARLVQWSRTGQNTGLHFEMEGDIPLGNKVPLLLSSDERTLYTVDDAGSVEMVDVPSGQEVERRKIQFVAVTACALAGPGDALLLSGGRNGQLTFHWHPLPWESAQETMARLRGMASGFEEEETDDWDL